VTFRKKYQLCDSYFNDLSAEQILCLSWIATIGIVVMLTVFWLVVYKQHDKAITILRSNAFFRTVTVVGFIAATSVLSLSGIIEGHLAAAILSGIAGFILGSHSTKVKEHSKNSTETSSTGQPESESE
jgi:predicted cation transporter